LKNEKMPLQAINLKDVPERTVAYMKCKGPWRQLPEKLASLDDHMARKGFTPTGPALGIYYNTPAEVAAEHLEWEVCRPIASETREYVEGGSGFGVRQLPAAKMATIIHTGSYRKTSSTYAIIEGWIARKGLKVCGPAEETYVSGLAKNQKEAKIEIRLPVC
jgi:effector-binding domain-containing protein